VTSLPSREKGEDKGVQGGGVDEVGKRPAPSRAAGVVGKG